PLILATRLAPSSELAQEIGEFFSPLDLKLSAQVPFAPRGALVAFWLLVVLALCAGFVHAVRRRYWCVLLLGAFLPLALRMLRNLPLLPLTFAVPVIWALPFERLLARMRLPASLRRATVLVAAAAVVAVAAVGSLRVTHDAYYIASRLPERFGVTWNRLALPVGLAEYARRVGLPPPMLNH